MSGAIVIRRLVEIGKAERAQALLDIDAIFFEASGRSFEPGPAREAFHERWLGRFITDEADHFFLAISGHGVIGYLAGCLDDPATSSRFADLGYYRDRAFQQASALYPASLHVNVAAGQRGSGIGKLLVEAFAIHARDSGAPGMHLVTGKGARNIGFYRASGFSEAAHVDWGGASRLMMVRALRKQIARST